MKTHTHIAILLAMTAMTVAIVLAYAFLSFQGVFFEQPFSSHTAILQTTATVYHPGDTVYAKASFCKAHAYAGVAYWTLADSYLRSFTPKNIDVPVGCYQDKTIALEQLPTDIPADTYALSEMVLFKINMVTTVQYHFQTNTFKVVKN